ncbi:MAG: hypothetical protein QXZ17_15730, partial [Nitrososphaerota archaeon]
VGTSIANLAINKRFFTSNGFDFRRLYLPSFSIPGFLATVLAFIIGIIMYSIGIITKNANLFAWSAVTSFFVAIILAVVLVNARRNEKFFLRPTIEYSRTACQYHAPTVMYQVKHLICFPVISEKIHLLQLLYEN